MTSATGSTRDGPGELCCKKPEPQALQSAAGFSDALKSRLDDETSELLDSSLMNLARVIGTVVATAKNEALEGRKLLVIQPINTQFQEIGKTLVAIDAIGAGAGETVFWCRGKEASFPFDPKEVPTDCTIVGIVDTIFVKEPEGRTLK